MNLKFLYASYGGSYGFKHGCVSESDMWGNYYQKNKKFSDMIIKHMQDRTAECSYTNATDDTHGFWTLKIGKLIFAVEYDGEIIRVKDTVSDKTWNRAGTDRHYVSRTAYGALRYDLSRENERWRHNHLITLNEFEP